jgi:hypothetical protein
VEVVERALVLVARLAGQPVADRVVTRALVSFWTASVRVTPRPKRMKIAGLWLGKTAPNRSPNASRLKPVGGERTAAPSSRQKPGFSPPPSSRRLAIRNAASPMKAPPMPVLM